MQSPKDHRLWWIKMFGTLWWATLTPYAIAVLTYNDSQCNVSFIWKQYMTKKKYKKNCTLEEKSVDEKGGRVRKLIQIGFHVIYAETSVVQCLVLDLFSLLLWFQFLTLCNKDIFNWHLLQVCIIFSFRILHKFSKMLDGYIHSTGYDISTWFSSYDFSQKNNVLSSN